jgi:hypothetical protein
VWSHCVTTGALYLPQNAPGCPVPDRIGAFSTHASGRAFVPMGGSVSGTEEYRSWTDEDVSELKAHSKARTPLTVIAKKMKRTEGALRQKVVILGIGLGHRIVYKRQALH